MILRLAVAERVREWAWHGHHHFLNILVHLAWDSLDGEVCYRGSAPSEGVIAVIMGAEKILGSPHATSPEQEQGFRPSPGNIALIPSVPVRRPAGSPRRPCGTSRCALKVQGSVCPEETSMMTKRGPSPDGVGAATPSGRQEKVAFAIPGATWTRKSCPGASGATVTPLWPVL